MTWRNFRVSALKCEGPKWENLDNAQCVCVWEQVHHSDTLGPSVTLESHFLQLAFILEMLLGLHKSRDGWLGLVSYSFLLGS